MEQTILNNIITCHSKPGYYFYLLQSKGYQTFDLAIIDQQTSQEIIPIISPTCTAKCFFSKSQLQKLLKNHQKGFKCRCGNIVRATDIFYQPLLTEIIKELPQTEKFIRILVQSNKWISLPITQKKQWRQVKQIFKMSPLSPSQYVQIKRQITKQNSHIQAKEILHNYLQYDILPLTKNISFLFQNPSLRQPSILINNCIYFGEEMNKYKFVGQDDNEPQWISFGLENKIFIGVSSNHKIYISELKHDFKKLGQQNLQKIFYCHYFSELEEFHQTKSIQIHLKLEQLYIYNGFNQFYHSNVLCRNQIQKQQRKCIKTIQFQGNIKMVCQLWCNAIYIHIKDVNTLVFDGNKKIELKLPVKLSTIGFVELNQNIITIIDFSLRTLVQVDIGIQKILNHIQIPFSQNQCSLINFPLINKTCIEWIDYGQKKSYKKHSILQL